jgi:hypothetical protein
MVLLDTGTNGARVVLMPNINLRLTEEEHKALRTWAFEGRRSIQREIIFRLFASDLPSHVKMTITEQENELTDYVKEQAGRDDLVVEMDLSPVNVTPRKPKKRLHACQHFVPPSKVCEICDF